MDASKVPAGVSQRFSKVGSLAKNPSSSFWIKKPKQSKKKPESTKMMRADGDHG